MNIRLAPRYIQVLAVSAMDEVDRTAALMQCTVEDVRAMWVPGVPVPTARTGGNGRQRYKALKTRRYQQTVCDASIAAGMPHVGNDNDEAAIVVTHLFLPRSNTRERAQKRQHRIADESGPDVDNVAKSILDGMQLDGGPLRDDRRVCAMAVYRRLAGHWCGPGALVVLARVRVDDE